MPNSNIIRTAPEAQGVQAWSPPAGTLGELVDRAWERNQRLPGHDGIEGIAVSRAGNPSLFDALRTTYVGVIAEIKRRSPSRGEINPSIDSVVQASLYQRGGAAAISVLTEPERFGGSNEDLERVRAVTRLPVLKKDFHVGEEQLVEAAQLGGSAALIIVRAIEPSRLESLASLARDLSLEIVFEVRDQSELDRALVAGARIIGVNNRNLETLEVDAATVSRLIPRIPPECIAIAESGYSTREDVVAAAFAGADAVLVGSALSAPGDPESAVRSIADVPRRSR